MSARELVVGTRGSALALAQTEIVCAELRRLQPDLVIRVERIATTGDVRTDVPLSQLDRGMFVTEIESAMRDGRIDVAVHSAKDLSSTTAPDLMIAAFLPRADARDVLISRDGRSTVHTLRAGARVGTSSPRRMAQWRALRPDVDARDVRGNVDTRLRKLRSGEYDALVLAGAGLMRLGRAQEITEWLDNELFVPCVGQGAIAVEVRAKDYHAIELVRRLDDADTRVAVLAERAFLAELGAGCRAAVAAHATLVAGGVLRMLGMIGSTEGAYVRGSREGSAGDPAELGVALAHQLLQRGAAPYLAPVALRGHTVAVTRPAAQSEALLQVLRAAGAEALCTPAIATEALSDTRELDSALADLRRHAWVVFTSGTAVRAVADRLDALRIDVPADVRLAAIGGATARVMRERMRGTDFVPSAAAADTLAAELPDVRGRSVLFPRADLAPDTVVRRLRDRGAVVRDVVAYRTVRGEGVSALVGRVAANDLDAIVFASPSAVRFVTDALDIAGIAPERRPLGVSIGGSTSSAARDAHWTGITQAATPTVGGIVEALDRAFSGRHAHETMPR